MLTLNDGLRKGGYLDMTNIKRGTTPTIRVRLDGIKPEEVKSVEFMFKPVITDAGYVLLHKKYPGDVTYDDTEKLWLLPLTQKDTRRLPKFKRVYMDTRITFQDGAIPATNIVDLSVTETLFGGDSV